MWPVLSATALLLPLAAASSSVRFPVVQDNIKFNSGVDSIKSSQLADLLSALNGYSIEGSKGAWTGLRNYNPLRHPSLFLIADFELGESMPELTMNSNLRYTLENDNTIDGEFASFKSQSVGRWPEAEGRMQAVDTGISDPDESDRLKEAVSLQNDNQFDSSKPVDRAFLLEYHTMKDVVSEAAKASEDSSPSTAYFLKLTSLRALAKEYGLNDTKTERARDLFSKLVGSATGQLESHPRSLFIVVQEDAGDENNSTLRLSRRRRELARTDKLADPKAVSQSLNLAYKYSRDFHVVFAIVTFTMLVLFLGILATSLGLWFMDPGRDSIIYRMTSQRMKMD